MIKRIKSFLMERYCPEYFEKMPLDNTQKTFECCIYKVTGYWGNKYKIVKKVNCFGYLDAYKKTRWMALVAQWKRPMWLCECGISYTIREIKT